VNIKKNKNIYYNKRPAVARKGWPYAGVRKPAMWTRLHALEDKGESSI